MNVQIERSTATGEKTIKLLANDTVRNPETIRRWIRMLEIAHNWLIMRDEVTPKRKPQPKKTTGRRA